MKLNELFGKSVYNQSEPHIYDKKMVKNSTVHNMVNLGIGHDHVTEGPLSNIAKAGAIAAASLGSDAEASSSSPDTQLKPVERQAQVRETITTSENEKILLTNAKKVGLRGTELAAFMAQAYHETGGFKYLEEQDDGSGKEYFNRYDIEHNPKLAKRLGNLKPGQGFKYRGFGYYQISGLYNYKKLSKDIGYDIYKNPSILKDPQWASVQALWYWRYRVKPNVTDFNNVKKITKLVNGGYNGLAEREELFKSYKMRLNPTVTERVTYLESNGDMTISDENKDKILSDFRVQIGLKIPNSANVWRGISDDTGSGMAVYGTGLYTTTNRKYATKYGKVSKMDRQALPDFPLRFDTINDYEIWLQTAQRVLGFDDNREFVKIFDDIRKFVTELGDFDGIQIGKGRDAMFVKYY